MMRKKNYSLRNCTIIIHGNNAGTGTHILLELIKKSSKLQKTYNFRNGISLFLKTTCTSVWFIWLTDTLSVLNTLPNHFFFRNRFFAIFWRNIRKEKLEEMKCYLNSTENSPKVCLVHNYLMQNMNNVLPSWMSKKQLDPEYKKGILCLTEVNLLHDSVFEILNTAHP